MINRRSMQSTDRQRGVALITVLLIVAIIVVIAANMTGRLQLLMSRSINMQASCGPRLLVSNWCLMY